MVRDLEVVSCEERLEELEILHMKKTAIFKFI